MNDLVEKIAKVLEDDNLYVTHDYIKANEMGKKILQAVLSHPNIIEVDTGAKLPVIILDPTEDFPMSFKQVDNMLRKYRRGIKRAGWVKPKE